jgi:hypothetical protein
MQPAWCGGCQSALLQQLLLPRAAVLSCRPAQLLWQQWAVLVLSVACCLPSRLSAVLMQLPIVRWTMLAAAAAHPKPHKQQRVRVMLLQAVA